MTDQINVYMMERDVTVLGPGNRFVIWVQGCHRSCPGCIAMNSHDTDTGRMISIERLAIEILLSNCVGLTISGGEPFLQAAALAKLIRLVRKKKDLGVIVYTGYEYEELTEVPGGPALLQEADLLIDGPYVAELDDGKNLRGSSNQRVIPLTKRYLTAAKTYGTSDRLVQYRREGLEEHLIGVPKGAYEKTAHWEDA